MPKRRTKGAVTDTPAGKINNCAKAFFTAGQRRRIFTRLLRKQYKHLFLMLALHNQSAQTVIAAEARAPPDEKPLAASIAPLIAFPIRGNC
jgi:hypothetical protein